ncbi:MAG: polysaccharide deacetylase family protein [Romboutsia sp.]|uniref:polysaccharide deacetylase family protein n=1 Tax=Romboutsia sp. TaxID=1965302 RepID=UPI003F3123BC
MKDIKTKNRKKFIRTIFQIIFCSVAIFMITSYLCFPKEYEDGNVSAWSQEEGFIALSYVGVARKSNHQLVSKDKLDEHLKALYDAGYVTIDSDDIIDYYKNGKKLPEKALFLTFEDGRKDSMIFAQPVLEKYNFKATMMNYAGNVEGRDRLFLDKKDLSRLDKSTYWEIGSNGYRFSYINVVENDNKDLEDYDNDGKYNKNKFSYTHYLMDYIRDEDGIPLETKEEMRDRINWDYSQMDKIYNEAIGYNPKAYMIMHSNKLNENMNSAVEAVNLENIYKNFEILFNREGSCYNTYSDSLYDLTRMQVGADWSVNKLLMEIENWTDSKSPFIVGDKDSVDRWNIKGGVMESKDEKIILTSPKDQKSFAALKGSDNWSDIGLSVYLSGREFGTQNIYLRYENNNSYIKLSLKDNIISIIEKSESGGNVELYSAPMPDSDKLPQVDDRFDKDRIDGNKIDDSKIEDTKVEDFNIKYQLDRAYKTNESDMESPVSWNLSVKLEGDSLSIYIGNEVLVENIKVNSTITSGSLAIECFSEKGIYDGIYDELSVGPLVEE